MRHFLATKIWRNLLKVRPIPIDFLCISVHIQSWWWQILATLFTFTEENLRWGQLRTPGFPDSLQAPLQCREGFDLRSMVCVEGLYCKRPIQRLASSKILTPPPPSTPGECVYPGYTLGGEGVEGQHFGRRQTLFCTLHMEVLCDGMDGHQRIPSGYPYLCHTTCVENRAFDSIYFSVKQFIWWKNRYLECINNFFS